MTVEEYPPGDLPVAPDRPADLLLVAVAALGSADTGSETSWAYWPGLKETAWSTCPELLLRRGGYAPGGRPDLHHVGPQCDGVLLVPRRLRLGAGPQLSVLFQPGP